jgi:hypothetical protein
MSIKELAVILLEVALLCGLIYGVILMGLVI